MTMVAAEVTTIAPVMRIVSIGDFVKVDEPGAAALLGADSDNALIPEGGDIMVYGAGGAGKTTLTLDLACHLAAGDAWLDIPIARKLNVLLIENEGPRPQFRRKLNRKRSAWRGGPLAGIHVLEEPWGRVSFADETHRAALAEQIRLLEIDIVVIGPLTRIGMNEAGTLQEVNDFMLLVNDVRRQAGRAVAVMLIHHENKGGQVSGAWEGAGDTLLHVQGQGHGRTRLFVQKSRWSSSHHGTSFHLLWTDGDGFELGEGERDDDTVADDILAYVEKNGGTGWNHVDRAVSGKAERKRAIREKLLVGERLVNLGTEKRPSYWHADDPMRPDGDASGTQTASGTGEMAERPSRPASRLKGDADGTDALFSPEDHTEKAA